MEKGGEAMIYPRGDVVHRDLSTAYTDFPALLATLKTEGFSGIIEIDFPENRGVIFVESGEIANAEAKIGGDSKRITGQEAIKTLMMLSNQKEGVIDIYRLPLERVAIIVSNLQHEILFKGLSTDFTRLDRLLLKLRDEKHNGFIEVLTKEKQAMGVLFLEGGEPVEMFTTPESGPSLFGRKSIPIFVENAIKQGAILDVYRSQGKMILKKEVKEAKEIKGAKEIREKKTPERGADLKELILIFQEILSKAEQLVDEASKRKGLFHRVFKESLIEKSEEFAFLDPFAGEFEYRDGTIQFTGEAGVKHLTKGIVECLVETLSGLEKELPKDKILPLKLKAGIESSLEQHSEALNRFGVHAITSSIFK
jgi:hypothetical protein